jgi:hypothetical protein
MTESPSRKTLPLVVICIGVIMLIMIFKNKLVHYGLNVGFLNIANVIIFFLTYFSFLIQLKGVSSKSAHAFVRGLYASLMLKMFVIIGGLFIYIYGFRGSVNVPALFVAMVLYLVYTSIEVKQLMKIARKKTDD